MTTISRRSDWPAIRADLEQQLATVTHQFIAKGSLEPDALGAFAKELSRVRGNLDHLNSMMCKACAIDTVGVTEPDTPTVSDEFLNSANGMRGLAETFVQGWMRYMPEATQKLAVDSLTLTLIRCYKDGLQDAK